MTLAEKELVSAKKRRRRLAGATAAALALGLAGPLGVSPAAAHEAKRAWGVSHSPSDWFRHWRGHQTRDPQVSEPLASGLLSPLSLVVDPRGGFFVSQSFAGIITKVGRDGTATQAAALPGSAIAGLDLNRKGRLAFTAGAADPSVEAGRVYRLGRGGPQLLADTAAFEAANNPDAGNSYGFQGLSAECRAQVPPEISGEASNGIVDTNPYAIAADGSGWYVADAGGNSVLRVSARGHVRTVAVLPPLPTIITAEIAAGMGLPECTIGSSYNFDPVPTDVEVGPFGVLYVSALPGGPEDASLGARGAVFRINPRTGSVKQVAGGLLGAVDLAVTPAGKIYVAEAFAGQISRIVKGSPVKVVSLPFPAALEYSRGKLYATTTADIGSPVGQVVSIRP